MARHFQDRLREPGVQPSAWIFCGVSGKAQAKQDKISIPVQEKEGRILAEKNGWAVTKILHVPGHSRSDTDFHAVADEMLRQEPPITAYDELRKAMRDPAYAPDYVVFYTGDRLGRSQSIIAFIIETLVRRGTYFYSLHDGKDIDKDNFRDYISRQGERAARGIDELVVRRRNTIVEQAAQGLPPVPHLPFTHVTLRDPKNGKRLKVVPDETYKPLIETLAQLLIEGHGWSSIGLKLKDRGFTRPDGSGRPYSPTHLRYTLYSPVFWGHNGLNYKGANSPSGWRVYPWMIEPTPDTPMPEGVLMFYERHEPMLTGELALRLKAELLRRTEIRGRTRPENTFFAAGLVRCGDCGCKMGKYSKNNKDSRYVAMRCFASYRHKFGVWRKCEHVTRYRADKIQSFVRELVHPYFVESAPIMGEQAKVKDGIAPQELELDRLKTQRTRLIKRQAATDDENVAEAYDVEIKSLTRAIKESEVRLDMLRTQAERARKRAESIRHTTDEIREIGEEEFWCLSDTQINQYLRRIFGKSHIIAQNGELFFRPE